VGSAPPLCGRVLRQRMRGTAVPSGSRERPRNDAKRPPCTRTKAPSSRARSWVAAGQRTRPSYLAKVGVAGSSPVVRSRIGPLSCETRASACRSVASVPVTPTKAPTKISAGAVFGRSFRCGRQARWLVTGSRLHPMTAGERSTTLRRWGSPRSEPNSAPWSVWIASTVSAGPGRARASPTPSRRCSSRPRPSWPRRPRREGAGRHAGRRGHGLLIRRRRQPSEAALRHGGPLRVERCGNDLR